jgi:aminoglycoside phosphotransferase (APT) family kinase protein
VNPDELRARLVAFLSCDAGLREVSVENLHRMPGGASRETWAFDAVFEEAGRPARLQLVLRRDPGSTAVQATGRREEFLLQRAAHARGVPVPRVRWRGADPDTLGADFYIMDRVEGETLARRLLRDPQYARAREVMTAQLGEILARIHAVDPAAPELDFLPRPAAGVSPAEAEVERYETLFRAIAPEPHPALELAFRWLRRHLPVGGRLVLVHGDYRIGNVIFGPEGVRAILDWEMAHVGDPAEDLGWTCVRAWRFGNDQRPVGGIGEREELFAAYARAGGGPVDAERVRFWEVFGNLKWAIICIGQARTHLDGLVRSIELASLGRRTAETELELLSLIE